MNIVFSSSREGKAVMLALLKDVQLTGVEVEPQYENGTETGFYYINFLCLKKWGSFPFKIRTIGAFNVGYRGEGPSTLEDVLLSQGFSPEKASLVYSKVTKISR